MIALAVLLLTTVIGLGIAALLIPGIEISGRISFILAAAVLGFINISIRPVLWLLTAPLSLFTFGLFTLVVNALMIMLAATVVPGFSVNGFGSALLGAIVMAVTGIISFISILLLTGSEINWYSYQYYSAMQWHLPGTTC